MPQGLPPSQPPMVPNRPAPVDYMNMMPPTPAVPPMVPMAPAPAMVNMPLQASPGLKPAADLSLNAPHGSPLLQPTNVANMALNSAPILSVNSPMPARMPMPMAVPRQQPPSTLPQQPQMQQPQQVQQSGAAVNSLPLARPERGGLPERLTILELTAPPNESYHNGSPLELASSAATANGSPPAANMQFQ